MNDYTALFNSIDELILKSKKTRLCVSIDGRCAAGKTTLAALLSEKYDAGVIHTDHFFLPPGLRTEQRYAEPGGNIDYERFKAEVIAGIKSGKTFSYRPFNCGTMDFGEAVTVPAKPLTIIEGAYCMRPDFREIYDFSIFVDVPPDEQLRRIEKRNGAEALKMFQNRWIPLEEAYIEAFGTPGICDLVL